METYFSPTFMAGGMLAFPDFPFPTPPEQGGPIKENPAIVGGNTGTTISLTGTVSSINQPREF